MSWLGVHRSLLLLVALAACGPRASDDEGVGGATGGEAESSDSSALETPALDIPALECEDATESSRISALFDGDELGLSMAAAGDINGDGFEDVLAGAPRLMAHNDKVESRAGRAHVLFGPFAQPDAGIDEVPGFVISAENERQFVAERVASLGDINADGLADLFVSATGDCYAVGQSSPHDESPPKVCDDGPRRSYVVFGKADDAEVALSEVAVGIGGFVIELDEELHREPPHVVSAGDVNGDGQDDFALGTSGRGGVAYVFFGAPELTSVDLHAVERGAGGFVIHGEGRLFSSYVYDAGRGVGPPLARAGDVNGDGLDDLVLGAGSFEADSPAEVFGRAYVVFGKADGEAVELADVSAGSGQGFTMFGSDDGYGSAGSAGATVAGAGDMNGDGLDDIVVSAPGYDEDGTEDGRGYVVWGKADAENIDLADVGGSVGGFFFDAPQAGVRLSAGRDVDGDGVPDLIIPAADHAPLLLRGKATNDAVVVRPDTHAMTIAEAGGWQMRSGSLVPDLNCDGLPDLVLATTEEQGLGALLILHTDG